MASAASELGTAGAAAGGFVAAAAGEGAAGAEGRAGTGAADVRPGAGVSGDVSARGVLSNPTGAKVRSPALAPPIALAVADDPVGLSEARRPREPRLPPRAPPLRWKMPSTLLLARAPIAGPAGDSTFLATAGGAAGAVSDAALLADSVAPVTFSGASAEGAPTARGADASDGGLIHESPAPSRPTRVVSFQISTTPSSTPTAALLPFTRTRKRVPTTTTR